jgi:peptide/nickel transport system permease protein
MDFGPRLGGIMLVALAVFSFVGPALRPYTPEATQLTPGVTAPSARHWAGTDDLGRDVFVRVATGGRYSLSVGLIAVAIGVGIGVPLGMLAGMWGGGVDAVIMRAIDLAMAFPSLLLALVVVAVLGPSLANAMIAVGLTSIPQYARLVRGVAASTAKLAYVDAMRVLGAGPVRILFFGVGPACAGAVVVQATLGLGTAILDAAGLSFLGLGAQPPTPEWGAMLSSGKDVMLAAPWIAAAPGLAVTCAVLSCNLLGDGLRDLLDPGRTAMKSIELRQEGLCQRPA